MRCVLPFLLIGSSLIVEGRTQRKTASKHTPTTVLSLQSQSAGAISVAFVSAPDGAALTGGASGQRTLDLGTTSYGGGTRTANVQMQKFPGRFVVSTKFGLSIQDGEQHFTSATVLAALAFPDPAYTFRLDGVKLEPVPQMVQGQAKIGTTFQHRLEIEVPSSITEKNAQVHNAIIFQVIPN